MTTKLCQCAQTFGTGVAAVTAKSLVAWGGSSRSRSRTCPMPRQWQGRWKGGRYYLDARNRPVYVIERRVGGAVRALTLETHDEDFANGELARFEVDPERYALAHDNPAAVERVGPVWITEERIALYLKSSRARSKDHR